MVIRLTVRYIEGDAAREARWREVVAFFIRRLYEINFERPVGECDVLLGGFDGLPGASRLSDSEVADREGLGSPLD